MHSCIKIVVCSRNFLIRHGSFTFPSWEFDDVFMFEHKSDTACVDYKERYIHLHHADFTLGCRTVERLVIHIGLYKPLVAA